MTNMTIEEQADIRIQLMTALIGAITNTVKALAVRVTVDGTLLLIAYFERPPLRYERQLLSDATAEAVYSLYRTRLEPDIRCVVTKRPVFEVENIEAFEEDHYGAATFRFWVYVRHGETPGDEEDHEDNSPLEKGEYTLLN
jgi:hypothetical protein